MPACSGLSSCLSSPQYPRECKDTYTSVKQQRIGDYDVSHSSQKDIRPANRSKANTRISAKELVFARSLLRELGITKNPYQDPTVKSNNCGMPYFPVM